MAAGTGSGGVNRRVCMCVVSKRIVKGSLWLGGSAGRVAFDDRGQGARWTIKRARQGACMAGAFDHSLNDAGRGDWACNKADLSLMRRHAAPLVEYEPDVFLTFRCEQT